MIKNDHGEKVRILCLVFCDIMLSCEMWSLTQYRMQMNGRKQIMQQETVKGSELPLTSIVQLQRHPSWPGSCQSWYVLTTDFTPQCQRPSASETA